MLSKTVDILDADGCILSSQQVALGTVNYHPSDQEFIGLAVDTALEDGVISRSCLSSYRVSIRSA